MPHDEGFAGATIAARHPKHIAERQAAEKKRRDEDALRKAQQAAPQLDESTRQFIRSGIEALPSAARPQVGTRAEVALINRLYQRSPARYAERAAEERAKLARINSKIGAFQANRRNFDTDGNVLFTQKPVLDDLEQQAKRSRRTAQLFESNKEPFDYFKAVKENVVEPGAGVLTFVGQSFIPGEQEVEKRRRELQAIGVGPIQSIKQAYTASDLPLGVKGALENVVDFSIDPTNALPGVGFGGVLLKTAGKAAAKAAAKKGLSKGLQDVLLDVVRMSSGGGPRPGILGPSGEAVRVRIAGGAQLPFEETSVSAVNKRITALEAAGGTSPEVLDVVNTLKQYRDNLVNEALDDTEKLEFAKAQSRFDSKAITYWHDKADELYLREVGAPELVSAAQAKPTVPTSERALEATRRIQLQRSRTLDDIVADTSTNRSIGPLTELRKDVKSFRAFEADDFARRTLTAIYDRNYLLKELQNITGGHAHDLAQLIPGAHAGARNITRKYFDPLVEKLSKAERANVERMLVAQDAYPHGHDLTTALKAELGEAEYAKTQAIVTDLRAARDEHIRLVAKQEGLSQKTIDAIEVRVRKQETTPLRQLYIDLYKTHTAIAINRTRKEVVESLGVWEKTTGDKLLERGGKLGDRSPDDWKEITFDLHGETQRYLVPRMFADVAQGLGGTHYGEWGWQAARLLSAPLRYGAVIYNPLYTPYGVFRDVMTAFLREKVLPPDIIMGMWAAMSKNSLYDDAAKMGALMGSTAENMKAIGGRPAATLGAVEAKHAVDLLLTPLHMIESANRVAEQGVRLGTLRKLQRDGVDAIEAAVRTRDVTVDFSKAGSVVGMVNQLLPFFNAGTQGTANAIRVLRDNPKWFGAYTAMMAAPTVAIRANNSRFETSDQIPDWVYAQYWAIQFGEGTRADGSKFPIYTTLPKPEFMRVVLSPIEAFASVMRKNEDRGLGELMLKSMFASAKTATPLPTDVAAAFPPAVATGLGAFTNKDFFTGRPIVPRREEDLLSEQQFGRDTATLSILLGQKSGISPRLIDFGIQDYLGGLGKTVNWAVSIGLDRAGFRPEQFGEAVSKEPQLEGIEKLSKGPAGRLVRTTATQEESRGWDMFNRQVEVTNKAFYEQFPKANELGVQLGEVNNSVNLIRGVSETASEITPKQRADFQRQFAELVLRRVPDLQLTGTAEKQQEQLRTAMSKWRREAEAKFIDSQQWGTDKQGILADRKLIQQYLDVAAETNITKQRAIAKRSAMRLRNPDLDAALIRWGLVTAPVTAKGRVAKGVRDAKKKAEEEATQQ